MEINFATGHVYLSSKRVVIATNGDSVQRNYIYDLSGLTASSGTNAFTFAAGNAGTARHLPFAIEGLLPSEDFPGFEGTLDGLAVDTINNVLYFSTGSILFDHDANSGTPAQLRKGGIFSYNLDPAVNATGVVTQIYEPIDDGNDASAAISETNGPQGLLDDLEISTVTGRWYVVDFTGDVIGGIAENGDEGIWSGNLNGMGGVEFIADISNVNDYTLQGFAINHAPTLSGNALAAAVTEAGGFGSGETNKALLFTGVTIADPDTSTADEITGAVVRISSNFLSDAMGLGEHQDLLRINNLTSGTIAGSGIAFSYSTTTGAMVLTGAATVAEYKAAIELVTFSSDGDNVTDYGANTTRQVAVSVSDGLTLSDEIFASIAVTGINDAPVNTLGGTHNVSEDGTGLVLPGMSINDVDANPATQDVTTTFVVGNGVLSISTVVTGGIVAADVTGGAQNSGTITVTATQNQINATLAAANGLIYTPTANYNGADRLTVTTNDQGLNGNDSGLTGTGTSEQDSDVRTINIANVNDAPTRSGDGTETFAPTISEDSASGGATTAALFGGQFSDALDQQQSGGNPTGSTANTFAGVAVVGNDSGATGQWQYLNGSIWVDMGARSTASALLIPDTTAIRFLPALNFNGAAPTLTTHLIDNSSSFTAFSVVNLSGAGATGGTTRYSTATVVLDATIAAVNDAPNVVNGTTATLAAINEDAANPAGESVDSLIFSHFSDADDTVTGGSVANTFAGVAVVGTSATTQGTWQYFDGTAWQSLNGTSDSAAILLTPSTMVRFLPGQDFNGAAPALNVRLVDSSTTFSNGEARNVAANGDPSAYSAGIVAVSQTITPMNDGGTLAGFQSSVTYLENTVNPFPQLLDGDVAFSDPEANFAGGAVTVSGLVGDDEVSVRNIGTGAGEISRSGSTISYQGAPIGTAAGGSGGTALTVTLIAAATNDAVDALIQALTYRTGSDNPPTSRTLSLNVTDADAAGLVGGAQSIEVRITLENDAPEIFNVAVSAAYTENADGTTLASLFTVSESDEENIESATAQITGGLTAGDQLTVGGGLTGTSGAISWSYTAATGTLSLMGSASAADYQALLRQVQFASTSDNPGAGDRVVSWSVNDGDVSSNTATTTVTVTPVNDAPVGAGPAVFADILENSTPSGQTVAAVFGPTFSDVDGDTLAGVAVAGNAATAAQGAWEYSTDAGATWIAIGTGVSEASALLLSTTALLRFLPAPAFDGPAPALTAYLIDSSAGAVTTGATADVSVNGGTTPYSDAAVLTSQTVTSVNEAPTATNLPQTKTYMEGDLTVALDDIVVSDADVDEDQFTATLTLDLPAAGEVTGFGTEGVDGSYTLTGTLTQVNAALAASAFAPATNNDQDAVITVSISDGDDVTSGTITLDVTPVSDFAGTAGDDTFVVTGDSFTSNGEAAAAVPAPATLDAGGGDDLLRINNPTGGVRAGTITFNGEGQSGDGSGDRLEILGGAHTTAVFDYTNANDGAVVLTDADGDELRVDYTGLEPVLVDADAAPDTVTFNLPGADDTIVLTDNGNTPGDGQRLLDSANGTFEDTTFTDPTGLLTINGGAGALRLNAAARTGDLLITTDQGLVSLGSIVTNGGDFTVRGASSVAARATATAAGNSGVIVDGGVSTGAGDIELRGQSGGGAGASGVVITQAVAVVSSTTGEISIDGLGVGTGAQVIGVRLRLDSSVSSTAGDVTITGVSDATGAGGTQQGVRIEAGADVETTGAADIAITGTGSTGSGQSNSGVVLSGAGTEIRSNTADSTGAITITGTGRGTGDVSFGILLENGALVSSRAGDITLAGRSDATAGSGQTGVTIGLGADVESLVSADILIDGTGGTVANAGSTGVTVFGSGATATEVRSLGSGDIFITGESRTVAASGVSLQNSTIGNAAMTGDILLRGLAGSGVSLSNATVQTGGGTGANATLNLTGGGSGSQSNGGFIVADGLRLLSDAAATVTLTAAGNDVNTIAGLVTGAVSFNDADDLAVGSVTSATVAKGAETTSTGLSATGTLALTAGALAVNANTSGASVMLTTAATAADQALTVAADVTVSTTTVGGSIILNAGDDLTLAADSSLNASGAVRISLDTGAADAGGSTAILNGTVAGAVITIDGGAEADTVTIGGIFLGPVFINGGGGIDTITGGAGAETLNGGAENDMLTGGGGNDTLRGGGGNDALDGGADNDTADFSDKTAAVVVTLTGATLSTATVGGFAEDTLVNIENVTGGGGNDALTGDGGINRLDGGVGNDTLTGGAGNDTLDGGAANDIAVFSGNRAQYVGTGVDSDSLTLTGPDGTDRVDNVETFRFADGDFTFAQVTAAPNVAPAGTNGTISTAEDTPRPFTAADFGFTDTDGDALAAVIVTTLPDVAAGVLLFDDVAIVAGQSIAAADLGRLTFAPAANANGAALGSFTFQVQDDGGVLNAGADTDASANTLTIDVTALIDAPVINAFGPDRTFAENMLNPVRLDEDDVVDFSDGDADFDGGVLTLTTDAADDELLILDSASGGGLTIDGDGQVFFTDPAATDPQVFIGSLSGVRTNTLSLTFSADTSQAAIAELLRNLAFQNNSDDPTETRNVTVSVTDAAGNVGAETISVTVTPENDAPVNQLPAEVTVDEDVSTVLSGVQVADPDDEQLIVTLSVDEGVLSLGAFAGDPAVTVTGAGTDTLILTGDQTVINQALTTLTYLGDPNFNGDDTLSIDTDDGDLIDSDTVAITVAPRPDLPVAVDDIDSVLSFGSTTGDVLDNDSDEDTARADLTVTSGVFAGVYGTLTLEADGDYTYAANNAAAILAGDIEAEVFTYTVSDDDGNSDTGTLTITIVGRSDGGEGADTIGGGTESGIDNTLNGNGGDDRLSGNAGSDTINGGAGNDTALLNLATGGSDRIDLGTGVDRIVLSGAGQVLLSLTAAEVGNGSPLDSDTLINQDGGLAVRLQAGGAGVTPSGPVTRADDEGISFSGAGVLFEVRDLTAQASRGTGFAEVTLGTAAGETLVAGPGRTYLNAGLGNDIVGGGAADDVILGGAGDDRLFGNGGNDSFSGGAGRDLIEGGAGNDVVDGTGADGNGDDALIGGDGNDDLNGGSGNDYLAGDAGDDFLLGATGNDELQGGAGNDVLSGAEGGDVLVGGSGDDRFFGGGGNDFLHGGEDGDLIEGGAGDDVLIGGSGSDYLVGNAGADVFAYEAANNGFDQIGDFETSVDRLNLFALRTSGADTVTIVAFDTYSLVLVDQDADGTIDFAVQINGAPGVITTSDIDFQF